MHSQFHTPKKVHKKRDRLCHQKNEKFHVQLEIERRHRSPSIAVSRRALQRRKGQLPSPVIRRPKRLCK